VDHRPRAAVLCAALLPFATAGHAHERAPAVAVFQKLQQTLQEDQARGDWTSYLHDAQRQQDFLNHSPASGLEVARAYVQLGQRAQALAEVNRILEMGQTDELLDSPPFRAIGISVAPRLASNQSAMSVGRPYLEFSDPGLLPEDIDYDSQTRRFFVTSILEHKILALDEKRNSSTFAEAPDEWPMIALKVDVQRRRLWATEVALDGFQSVVRSAWGRSVLLEYDLDSRTLLARYEGPVRSNLGDMTLTGNGNPIVSDGTGGGVYRLQNRNLHRIDRGDFISPQTIALCEGVKRAFVPDYVRGLAQLDLDTGAVRWISMKNRFALDGVDGLYCHHGVLMATQNGASPERVIAFFLDGSRAAIAGEQVLERTRTLDPTHGVFVNDDFFYIANSGWNALDDHGAVKPGAHLTPALLMKIDGRAVGDATHRTGRGARCRRWTAGGTGGHQGDRLHPFNESVMRTPA
jgi:hypothetical protein